MGCLHACSIAPEEIILESLQHCKLHVPCKRKYDAVYGLSVIECGFMQASRPTKAFNMTQAAATGGAKAGMSAAKTFVLGTLGGAFIGFGSFLAISIGGACPGLASANPGLQKMVYGAFGLPFGLLLVLLCGAELFTGNTALVTAAVC